MIEKIKKVILEKSIILLSFSKEIYQKICVKFVEYGVKWYHIVGISFVFFMLQNIQYDYALMIGEPQKPMVTQNASVVNVEPPKEQDVVPELKKDASPEKKSVEDKKLKKDIKATKDQSEFAPSDPDKLDKYTTEQYIKKFKGIAISEMKRTGVPASITLAQGIIESASGNSRLARQINNHFGIKCHSRNCKKGHCKNYTDDSHKDFFMSFKTAEDSYRAHSAVVLKERYTSLLRGRRDYKSWAWALQNGGYATGNKYAQKLIRVIEKYKLNQYDK
jgi:flagellum-specific peptidoglycan hydrolase FlgJ